MLPDAGTAEWCVAMNFVSNDAVLGFIQAIDALRETEAFWKWLESNPFGFDPEIDANPNLMCAQYLAWIVSKPQVVPPSRLTKKMLAARLWLAYVNCDHIIDDEQLSHCARIPQPHLQNILMARDAPSSLDVAKLAECLHVSTDELFSEPTDEELSLLGDPDDGELAR